MLIKRKSKPSQSLNPKTGKISYISKRPPVVLKSTNTNGVFTEDTSKKPGKDGKPKEKVNFEACVIINTVTGEYISDDLSPKFEGWKFDDYRDLFHRDASLRYLDPMGAQEPEEYIYEEGDIAELKRDGHRALMHITAEANRVFSRYPSKTSGWHSENTDRVPHFRDLPISNEYLGTVLDGEMDYGTDSRGVQSVMGALPENAIQHQYKEGFIPYYVFDILYYKGVSVQQMPLWKRKVYAAELIYHISEDPSGPNFKLAHLAQMFVTTHEKNHLGEMWRAYIKQVGLPKDLFRFLMDQLVIVDSYNDKFQELVSEGLEGLIVKDINGTYQQGMKSKYQLKLKGKSTWDVVYMGLTEPVKEYTGKRIEEGTLHEWEYWYNTFFDEVLIGAPGTPEELERMTSDGEFIPVTKPYAMGWCGGIRCGVYKPMDESDSASWGVIEWEQAEEEQIIIFKDNVPYELVEVAVVKGLTEETMIDLKKNGDDYYWEKRTLEITANGIQDKEKGTLRHPRFKDWRDDKPYYACTFEDHIRKRD